MHFARMYFILLLTPARLVHQPQTVASWGGGLSRRVSSRFAETRFAETRFAETRFAEIRVRGWCLPDSPKPDSPKLGFRVRVSVSANRVSANRD